jgi:hypothetical protein
MTSIMKKGAVGLIDQGMSSLSNVLAIVMVAQSLSASAFGSFTVSYAILLFVVTLARSYSLCTSPKGYSGLSEGPHTFSVRARDSAGNGDPTPATYDWTVDTAAPKTTIDSGPSGTVGSASASFEFSSDEANSTFECKLDGGAYAACSSPQAYSGLSEGSHTFSVRATDAAGNAETTPSTPAWSVDSGAPETTIDSKPPARTNSNSASFAFSSAEAGSTFECKLDGGAYAACSSPEAYSNLSEGSHTFSVKAADSAGNMDATPDNYMWTVDATAPETAIDSGPSGTVGSASASFAFSSDEAGSTFECGLDGAFSACSSPKAYSNLAEGLHTFSVRAKDQAGNTDATPGSRTWSVDTGAPETTIDSKPPARTNSTSATFAFSSDEAGATFECRLDGAAFSPCASPKAYSGLSEGSHTFFVSATDALGNADATPASDTWTVDTTAPAVEVVTPVDGATSVAATVDTTATFSEAMDPATLSVSTFTLTRQGASQPVDAQVSYDAATRKATLNPNVDLQAATAYTATFKSGTGGVKDVAGNPLGPTGRGRLRRPRLQTPPRLRPR